MEGLSGKGEKRQRKRPSSRIVGREGYEKKPLRPERQKVGGKILPLPKGKILKREKRRLKKAVKHREKK